MTARAGSSPRSTNPWADVTLTHQRGAVLFAWHDGRFPVSVRNRRCCGPRFPRHVRLRSGSPSNCDLFKLRRLGRIQALSFHIVLRCGGWILHAELGLGTMDGTTRVNMPEPQNSLPAQCCEEILLPELSSGLRKLVEQTFPHQVISKLASASGLSNAEIVRRFAQRKLTETLSETKELWGNRSPEPFNSWHELLAGSLSRPVSDFVHTSNSRVRRRLRDVLNKTAGVTEMSVFFENQRIAKTPEETKEQIKKRAQEISQWCADLDDYPWIACLQDCPTDSDALTKLQKSRNDGLIAWFSTSPGVRHPQTGQFIKGPTEGSQRAAVSNSAEDLAQETWAYLTTGVIPGTNPRATPTPKIRLFDPTRGSVHGFLQYWGSVVLLRFYSKNWPAWAVFVAIMDLSGQFPGLEIEAEVLEHLPPPPTDESEGDGASPFGPSLKSVHDLVTEHFRIAYGLARPVHELVSWVLIDSLRRRPRHIVPQYEAAKFGEYSLILGEEFFRHFADGSKAESQLIRTWWQPTQRAMTGAPNETLVGNATNPNNLRNNLSDWAFNVRDPIIKKLGDRRHLFDLIKQIADERGK